MYAIDVEFKNGAFLEGLVWSWEPEEGWFKALDESNGKIKTYLFDDVVEGKFYSDRIRKTSTTEDLLEKAKQEGYERF